MKTLVVAVIALVVLAVLSSSAFAIICVEENSPRLQHITTYETIQQRLSVTLGILADSSNGKGSTCGITMSKAGHSVCAGSGAETADLRANLGEELQLTTNSTPPIVRPLWMSNHTLGGSAVWGYQWDRNVNPPEYRWMQYPGLNTIGLLVAISGRITQIDPGGTYFYIDDGAGADDGTKTEMVPGVFENNKGVRVLSNPAGLSEGYYVVVTGLSSLFVDEGYTKKSIQYPSQLQILGQ